MTRSATARLAGLLYLASLPTAGFCFGYVEFLPHANPAETLAALQAARQVLPWTVFAGILGFAIDYPPQVLLLRRLLAPTNQFLADLMTLFVVASIPLALAALADRLDLMSLLDTAPTASAAVLHLQREHHLFQLASVFWGLWLLPLGGLLWRSRLAPRPIAGLLIFAGFGYLWGVTGPLLVPHYTASALDAVVGGLTMIGELGFALWFTIRGVRETSSEASAR